MKRNSLSIVVPSYNQADYIGKCLDSICSQLRAKDELFVIDGGSTDGSRDIIRSFEKHITFWRSEKDQGQTWAINYGMNCCKNSIVAWLNSDDYYLPNALNFVRKNFDTSEYDMIYGDVRIVNQYDETIRRAWHGYWDPYRLVHGGYDIDQQACFWRREWWQSLGGLNESYYFCMDVERHYRDARAGARAKHFPVFLAAYRRHEETKSSKNSDIRSCELNQLKDEYKNYLPLSHSQYRYKYMLRQLYVLWISRGAALGNFFLKAK